MLIALTSTIDRSQAFQQCVEFKDSSASNYSSCVWDYPAAWVNETLSIKVVSSNRSANTSTVLDYDPKEHGKDIQAGGVFIERNATERNGDEIIRSLSWIPLQILIRSIENTQFLNPVLLFCSHVVAASCRVQETKNWLRGQRDSGYCIFERWYKKEDSCKLWHSRTQR